MGESIVVVGGAGQMGSCAVSALVADGHDVLVADRRPPSVAGARFAEADASDREAMERLAKDASLVMNFTGPFYVLGDTVARAAIAQGVPYIDICDDAAATEELLGLGDQARDAGVALVLGVGCSPGALNGFALRAAAGFESVERLTLAWVVGEHGPSGPAPLRHFFYGITQEIPIWRHGAREMIPAFMPESEEEFPFPDPVGSFVVRDVGHPETVTLPLALEAGEIRSKGAVVPRHSMGIYDTLRNLGLIGETSIRVGDNDIVARDFVAALLTERHNQRADDGSNDVIAVGVRASGTVAGTPTTRCIASASYATMAEATALPTVAAVPQLLAGTVPAGSHGPEVLDVADWFSELSRLATKAYGELVVWDEGGGRSTVSLEQFAGAADPGDLLAVA